MLGTGLGGLAADINWADMLPEIEFSINATEHKTFGISPAEIIYEFKINITNWFENNKLKDTEEIRKKIIEKQDTIQRNRRK